MSLYETTFIARQDMVTADAEALADSFADLVKELDGKVIKKEYWGLRSLAYKINKSKKGHYFFFGIDATADAVRELERKYRLSEDIVRSLTVRVDEIDKEPSPILKQAEDVSRRAA